MTRRTLRAWLYRHLRSDRAQLLVQFGKFGLVGIVGLVVDTAVLYSLILGPELNPYGARVLSFLAAATTTWALNRSFTFRGEHDGSLLRQWLKFLAANAFGGMVNYAVFAGLTASAPLVAQHPFLGVAAGSVAGMFFNFAASRKLVFRIA
jgi:putative flippase GtrA